jgi:ATP-binding cassette subfamily C (CFTR/MRP) protein 1
VLNALSVSPHTSASTAAGVLRTLDCFALANLSFFEHVQSFKPSSILNLYLLSSSVFDAAQVRTLWLLPVGRTLAAVSTATLVCKVSLLVLEATEKRSLLRHPYKTIAIESTSGIGNRSIFLWLNPLIWQGYRKLLAFDDLQKIDDALGSRTLQDRFYLHWTGSRYTSRLQVSAAG